jgi:hypothetical protein
VVTITAVSYVLMHTNCAYSVISVCGVLNLNGSGHSVVFFVFEKQELRGIIVYFV